MIFPNVANLKINAYGCQIESFDPSQLFKNLRKFSSNEDTFNQEPFLSQLRQLPLFVSDYF